MDRFETGMQFGQAIQRISQAESQIGELASDLDKLQDDLKGLRSIIIRGSILGGLWLTGLGANLSAEVVGKAVGAAVLKALKLG
jgi:hypothetical protein